MDDDNVNVDDLFNEADLEQAALNIPLPGNDVVETQAQPVPLETKLQLDALHANGCRRRVAWSRLGCVASISEDSSSVSIQCLRLNRKTAVWELSSKYPLKLPTDEAFPHLCTHLSWSSTGTDFAIFDTRGRVSIFGMATASAINRFQDLGFSNTDQGDELREAVGAFWLPAADRESPAISMLSKQGEYWKTMMTKRKPMGPAWPRALLFATRIGELRLLYMKLDRTWSETTVTLETPATAKDLLTHAAFAPIVDGSLMLTTHSSSGNISVYSVQVNRPILNPNQDPTVSSPITMNLELIKTGIRNGRTPNAGVTGDLLNSTPSSNNDINCLSHLEIVPATDIEESVQTRPTIFAVNTLYSYIPAMNNSFEPRSSMIHRWSLYTVSQTLHPRFDDGPTRGAATANFSPKSIQTLQRLPDIPFEGIITSVYLVDNASALVITTLDGTTSFYNPSTMSPIFYEASTDEVTSLSQAGYTFAPTASPFSIAFSSNACCAVSAGSSAMTATKEDVEGLMLNTISHHSCTQDTSDSNLDPALASLLLTYTRACYSGSSTDDILTCILRTVSPTHVPQLSNMIMHTLFHDSTFIRHGEPGSDLDKIAQKLLVPKALSLLAALGINKGNPLTRSVPAEYAWLVLNLRQVAMQLVCVVNSVKQPSGRVERLTPEIVRVTSDTVSWVMTFLRAIVDEICAVEDREEGDEQERKVFELLLGGLWSRYFLRMMEKVLHMFASGKFGLELRRGVTEQQRRGLKLSGLGQLLEASERFSTESNGSNPAVERELFTSVGKGKNGGLLERLARETLPALRKSGDVDKLAVYTSMLGEKRKWIGVGEGVVDVHRKTGLGMKGEVRRCVRCAAVSKDVAGPKKEWPKWLQQQQMRCVCEAGFWIEGVDQ